MPTPVLSGDADPITPPAFARVAVAILGGGARMIGFPHVGHGVEGESPRGEQVGSSFMRLAPTDVDVACAAALPPVVFR